jgi:Domain of unknown function (DUF4281)
MTVPWEVIFSLANGYAALCWLLLLFSPNRETVLPRLFQAGCGLLSATYSVLMVGLMTGLVDAGGPGNLDLTSLTGVMEFFDNEGSATVGWIHYLAFDLFVGVWVARNADVYGYSRLTQVPLLALVFLLGPIGLTLYLALRLTRKSRSANAIAPG